MRGAESDKEFRLFIFVAIGRDQRHQFLIAKQLGWISKIDIDKVDYKRIFKEFVFASFFLFVQLICIWCGFDQNLRTFNLAIKYSTRRRFESLSRRNCSGNNKTFLHIEKPWSSQRCKCCYQDVKKYKLIITISLRHNNPCWDIIYRSQFFNWNNTFSRNILN